MKPIQIRMPEGSRTITLMLNIEIVPVGEVTFPKMPRLTPVKRAKKLGRRTPKVKSASTPARVANVDAYKKAFEEQEIPLNVFQRRRKPGCACIAVDANYLTEHLAKCDLKGSDLAINARVHQSVISTMTNGRTGNRKDHSRFRRVSLNAFFKVYNHLPKAGLDIKKLLHPFNEPHNHCSPIYGGPRG